LRGTRTPIRRDADVGSDWLGEGGEGGSTVKRAIIAPETLGDLVVALERRGFRVVGPRVDQQAIVYGDLGSADDLPIGWTEEQEAATYRLERRDDDARFGYAVGPHSWKQFLFPPRVRQWTADRAADGSFEAVADEPDERPLALIGVRSCELHAIAIQDRVFLGGPYVEHDYAGRREELFVVAVNCFEPGGTCFCVSMGTGPKVEAGYDLALTEILDGEHRFLVEAGTERGLEVLRELAGRDAEPEDLAAAESAVDGAAARMGRTLEAGGLRDLLAATLEHSRWEDVASRCLTCGNCTMVCPTCFCSTVEDVTDLGGDTAERHRVWDSCFSVDHAYLHGGSIRPSGRSRYRQWLTHKFGTWHDQFGTSGCVGCGRCITWCPVGIDVTEELAALRLPEEESRGDD
jgi:ferredoxin